MASGADEDAQYQLDLVLFAAVDKEKSKITVTPRSIFLVLEKQEADSWPRLTKESGRWVGGAVTAWRQAVTPSNTKATLLLL